MPDNWRPSKEPTVTRFTLTSGVMLIIFGAIFALGLLALIIARKAP